MLHRTIPNFLSQCFEKTRLIFIVGCVLVTACSSDMTDLERFVAEMKARKNPNVEPLPKFEIVTSYFYEADNLRDPFAPLLEELDGNAPPPPPKLPGEVAEDAAPCPKPDSNRVRVGLELLPLDALQMVGTLKEDMNLWGLVMSKTSGTLYKVKVGDYMGRYYGKIISITETKISVMEFVPDAQGCYWEKENSISR